MVWKRLRILDSVCPPSINVSLILVLTLTWYQDVLYSFLSPPIKGPTDSDGSSQAVVSSSS